MRIKTASHISRILCFVLVLSFAVGIGGCKRDTSPFAQTSFESLSDNDNISLWVVTEQTMSDGMNAEAELLCERFSQQHPNVSIRLDILPTEKDSRTAYLKELRETMESDAGPDIYLLPTRDILILDSPSEYTYRTVELLFPDVSIAMQAGQFTDIDSLYSEDTGLKSDELVTAVMDSGKLGQERYVLPLRYDIPVIYAFSEDLQEIGADSDLLYGNIDKMMDYAITVNNAALASGLAYPSFNAFSQLIDYEQKTVALSSADLQNYIEKYQKLMEVIGTEFSPRSKLSLQYPLPDKDARKPLYIDQLQNAFTYLAIAQCEGKELLMKPLRSCDGDLIASVTYYGAIDASCQHIDVAYAFLRQFLLEDSQWEENRKITAEAQHIGMMENGWPIRSKGSASSLWEKLKMQDVCRDYQAIQRFAFTDESIPVLAESIDIVRFPFPDSFQTSLSLLNDSQTGSQASDVNIEELAVQLISELDQKIVFNQS